MAASVRNDRRRRPANSTAVTTSYRRGVPIVLPVELAGREDP
jgi:hypothetical protein